MKRVNNPISLLSGVLVCDECGSFMRPRVNSNKERNCNGEQTYSYLCELKKRSNGKKCSSTSIHGNELDQRVAMEVLARCQEGGDIYKSILAIKKSSLEKKDTVKDTLQSLRDQIDEKDRTITNYLLALGHRIKTNPEDTDSIDHINSEISRLASEVDKMKEQLQEQNQLGYANDDKLEEMEQIRKGLETFRDAFFTSSVYEKRDVLRTIVNKVIWDGRIAHIYLGYDGEDNQR